MHPARRPTPILLLLVLLLAGCTAHTRPGMAGNSPPLVGTWRAVRYGTWDEQGRTSTPFGDPVSGYAVFDATGHAFIQLMRTPPVPPLAAPSAPTSEESRAAFSAFAAYFGPYSLDEAGGSVTIRVEGSSMPSYTGSRQVRPFRIEGDTLKLGIPGQATLVRVR